MATALTSPPHNLLLVFACSVSFLGLGAVCAEEFKPLEATTPLESAEPKVQTPIRARVIEVFKNSEKAAKSEPNSVATIRATIIETSTASKAGAPVSAQAATSKKTPEAVSLIPTNALPSPKEDEQQQQQDLAKVEPFSVEKPASLVDIGAKDKKERPAKPVAESKLVEKPKIEVAKPKPTAPPSPAKPSRSSWRNRYELGPGDALNFALHGQPKLKKLAVPIAPDGTVSYLQAKQVDVRGKTIDELRGAMNAILKDYHGDSKLIITPAALGSKRYTVLGEVRNNGSYPLERPTTLLHALARSGGFNLGSSGTDAIELADLRRSFVVRHGDRMKVDMESLYLKGDMTQNVQLEPGDYIYVASKLRSEVYVFGAVAQPGVKPMESGFTTLGAIAAAGGFNPEAWKDRVLVIRGRLDQPEAKIAHIKQVLHGKETDFELEPGDIVYVHTRPWTFAEKLLDTAIIAYIDGSVAGWLADGTNISVSAGR